MRSLQDRLEAFYGQFASLPCDVRHFTRQESFPYMVWQEHGEGDSLEVNNRKAEQVMEGTIDYFTKHEFDKTVDAIQEILDSADNIGWTLTSVMYEDETNLIHYSWDWELS